jgi:quinol monooxygenase YgiN
MPWSRREFAISSISAAAALGGAAASARGEAMYGLISQITTAPGRRDELAGILLAAAQGMPGCLSYVVAADPAKPDALWITEVWADKDSHAAALRLPAVQQAIASGRPLIAGVVSHAETTPIGGVGLPAPGAG